MLAGPLCADIDVRFDIDLGKNNRDISPLIYGSNSDELTQGDGVTFRRSGGNRLTGYNWENNASHAGMDWQNSSDGYMGGGEVPGKAITDFHDKSLATGATSLVTLPAAGYVSKDKDGTVTEAQAAPSARWVKVVYAKGKPFSATPDVNDGEVYTDEFVDLLVKKYGGAGSDKGIRYYSVDNEPGLWRDTHPRLHPAAVTGLELVQKTVGTATAVKKVDPKAEIFGGVFFGYGDYANLNNAPDWDALKAAGKYAWYIDYFLDEMRKASEKAGTRLLDVLDIHWYSEAMGDHRINVAAATTDKDRVARMQAPRSLWDSAWVENSWISQWQTPKQPVTNPGNPTPGPILLLPHLFASIAKYYPGTKLAITEFNYGEANHVTGGIAAADYLGILGREGVFASNFWQLDEKPTSIASAFRLFRNFDGKGATFGSISTAATASDRENASVYASFNSGGDEVHIIVLNKSLTETIRGTFNLTSPLSITTGRVFGFEKSGPTLGEKVAPSSISGKSFTYAFPPLSAHHLVLKMSGATPSVLHTNRLVPSFRNTRSRSDHLANGRIFPALKKTAAPVQPLFGLPSLSKSP